MYDAQIIADSMSPNGARLTTMQITYPRFVHSELMTHRVFSRNAASSRARPIEKVIEQVLCDPATPVEWGANQRGMQANELLPDDQRDAAIDVWLQARTDAVVRARCLMAIGAHKQIVNRLLEPWVWITTVVTATEWDGFWRQRCSEYSPLAQPELRHIADMMLAIYRDSTPRKLSRYEWHLPYISDEERDTLEQSATICISAARCARTSYLTQEGKRDPVEDLKLYARLTSAKPMHASPLEHPAYPCDSLVHHHGNFRGFHQLRELVETNPTRSFAPTVH